MTRAFGTFENASEALEAYRRPTANMRRPRAFACAPNSNPFRTVLPCTWDMVTMRTRLSEYVPGMTHDDLHMIAKADLNTMRLRVALDMM
jgi:hypothetical protein